MSEAGAYLHARLNNRAKREIRRLKTYFGRVARDVTRKIAGNAALEQRFATILERVARVLAQQRHDRGKLYSLHAPEVECLAKGKAHKKYEFGVKISVAATNRSGFVLGMLALPGSPGACPRAGRRPDPGDGHTIAAAARQAERLTRTPIERLYVDRGYRGHNHPRPERVFISGQRRAITPTIRKELRRRSAIEPIIGHMKQDGRLGRNYLLGSIGDALNAILCGVGYNLRLIRNWLRYLLVLILAVIFAPQRRYATALTTVR